MNTAKIQRDENGNLPLDRTKARIAEICDECSAAIWWDVLDVARIAKICDVVRIAKICDVLSTPGWPGDMALWAGPVMRGPDGRRRHRKRRAA